MASTSSVSPAAVVYRREQLPELVAALVIEHFTGEAAVRLTNCKSQADLNAAIAMLAPEETSSKPVVVFGSYYKTEELEELAKKYAPMRIIVHTYLADAKARAFNSAPSDCVTYETVDAAVQSFAAFAWQRYAKTDKQRASVPETLKLMDCKGRSDYTSDERMKPFIEWLYTKGCTEELVQAALFDYVFPLEQTLSEGALFAEKSDSLVRSIASTAGFYTRQGARIAVVDAQRQIELLGEELCRGTKQPADYAIITRFDHVLRKTRYTVYCVRPEHNAVAWARALGFDAGGSERISGFTSEKTVPQLLELLH